MLGFHQSQHSARFFLENNSSAAVAIAALSKRMQGAQGRLMHISAEPCTSFLILNAQQIAVVKKVKSVYRDKMLHYSFLINTYYLFVLIISFTTSMLWQVLEKRYDPATSILDLSRFHYDPIFLAENIMPVLWDPPICKQVKLRNLVDMIIPSEIHL